MECGSEKSKHHLHHQHHSHQHPAHHQDQQQQKKRVGHTLNNQKKIYTDWANHYLAKSGHQRLIKDLQQDLNDGVLLAQVIQVVANEKICGINGVPKTRAQMIENIEVSLGFLAAKGINIQGLSSEEINGGNLKTILSLFFSLSKYKQQQHHKTVTVRQTGLSEKPITPEQASLIHTKPRERPRHTPDKQRTPSADAVTKLPAPIMRVPPGMASGIKSPSPSRPRSGSLSFSHYDRPRACSPGLQPAASMDYDRPRACSPGLQPAASMDYDRPRACSPGLQPAASMDYDRPRAFLQPAASMHEPREGNISPTPPITTERALSPEPLNPAPSCSTFSPHSLPRCTSSSSSSLPLPTTLCRSTSPLAQSVFDSSSYKAWKSKSLDAKHSAISSSLLSVRQTDTLPPSLSPPSQALSRSLPQLLYQAPVQQSHHGEDQNQTRNHPKTLALSLPQPLLQNQAQPKPQRQPRAQGGKALEVPPKVIAQKSMLEKLKLFNSKSATKAGIGGDGSTGPQADARRGRDVQQKKGRGEKRRAEKTSEKVEREEKSTEKGEKRRGREKRSQSVASIKEDALGTSACSPPPPVVSPAPPSPAPSLPSPKQALRTLGRALTSRKGTLKQGDKDRSNLKQGDKDRSKAVLGFKDRDKAVSRLEDRPGAKDKNGTKEKENAREKNGGKEKVKAVSVFGSRRSSQSGPLVVRQEGVGSEAERAAKKGTTIQLSSANEIDKSSGTKKGSSNNNTAIFPSTSSTVSATSIPKPVTNNKQRKGSFGTLTCAVTVTEGERRDSNDHPAVRREQTDREVEKLSDRRSERQRSASCSGLEPSQVGCSLHQAESATTVPPVAGNGAAQSSVPISATASVQLPRTQLYSHHNMATVAPYVHRSQPDVTGAGFLEVQCRKATFSQSAHSSLEDLTSEDPVEVRRLQTVRNMADLRQNLQETMSCLRGTQISHCYLDSSSDADAVTEADSSSGGVKPLPSPSPGPGPPAGSTLPWRLATMARPPRLQAGDAPSTGSVGYRSVPRLSGRADSPVSGRYLKRPQPAGQEREKADDAKASSSEAGQGGYSSDGDVLGKTTMTNSTRDLADRQFGVFCRRMASLSQLDVMTSSVASSRRALQLPVKDQRDYDSWDDSSSVSSGISDGFDLDDIRGSSSLHNAFANTPPVALRKDVTLETEAGCENRGAAATECCNARYLPGADMTDKSQHSSSGRKTPSIGQTGSWRRGMTAQVGVASPRAKTPQMISMTTSTSLKTQGTAKTDDAKVSERSCLSPRSLLLLHSPSSAGEDVTRRPAGTGSARTATTTSTLGFKKYLPGGGGSGGTSLTSSGVTITSGSATVGKLQQHHSALTTTGAGGGRCQQPGFSARSMGRHGSVDDGCLSSVSSRQSVLQYRSLPRPSRSHGHGSSSAGNRSNSSIMTAVSHAAAAVDIPGTDSRVNTSGTKRSVGASKLPSVNRTDRDKGGGGGERRRGGGGEEDKQNGVVCGGEDSGLGGSGDSVLSLGSRRTRGKYPDVASTTLPRYGHLSPLRGEEPRDWLRSHSGGGVQEAGGASSPSPSGGRFTYSSQLGSTTVGNSGTLQSIPRGGGVANGLSNQETGSCDTHKSSNMSLDEKSRTISSSGSFRDGLEEVNGSSLSLVSSTSSVYSTTPEEKSQSEIRKLRRELDSSQEKVSVLSTQLNANSHLVAAFEQSLGNMTVRLQNLTTAAEQKDSELSELRRTIEELKKHNNNRTQAAINTAINTAETCTPADAAGSEQGSPVSGGSSGRSESSMMVRQPSTDSVTSLTSVNSHTSRSSSLSSSNNDLHSNHEITKKKTKNWLRSSFKQAFGKRRTQKAVSSHSDVEDSSLPTDSKLSSGQKKQQNASCPKASSQHNQNVSKTSHNPIRTGLGSPHSGSLISEVVSASEERETVMLLRTELRDKEMKLTDIRLEALSSAHQLDTLREAMARMQGEMETLRQENMRLKVETQQGHNDQQHSVTSSQTPAGQQNQNPTAAAQSLMQGQHQAQFNHNHHNHNAYQNQQNHHHGSQQSNGQQQQPRQHSGFYGGGGGGGGVVEGRLTHPCVAPTQNQQHASNVTESTGLDMLLLDGAESGSRKEGRHVKVVVSLSHRSNTPATQESNDTQFLIGCMRVSGRTRWDVLDGVVRSLFKEYVHHVDPVGQLGLSSDSVLGYSIADVHRHPGLQTPELLPCGYLVGDSDTISVCLKDSSLHCPDGLVFETLVPLPIMKQYISQLQERRCVVLSGPGGTGKSFLAARLAEHFVLREGLDLTPGRITTFSVGDDNVQEVHQSLCKLCEQFKGSSNSGRGDRVLPLVVIVENLHNFPSPPTEVINGLCNSTQHHCPYVIGTMSQTCPAELQPQHSLSWITWSSKAEPVKGFLGRFLRRQLVQAELSSRCRNPELNKVVDWLLAVWQHLDNFLDTHTSADVSIGPGLFLSCPMSVEASRMWFTRLWNYAVVPYCLKALRQLSDAGAEWEDPTDWVVASWPWSSGPAHQELLRLCSTDARFSSNHVGTDPKNDPMVSMLQKLKDVTHCYHSNGTYDSTAEPAPESAI